MRPKKRNEKGTGDLFRARLDQIINMKHEPVRLAEEIDWDWIDDHVADCFASEGRPGTETRFMIGILLLKQIYGLSDEFVFRFDRRRTPHAAFRSQFAIALNAKPATDNMLVRPDQFT